MKLDEEKQLKDIKDEFLEGIKVFRKRDYQDSAKHFNRISEKYKDSEYYSVLEIQARAKVYKNIAHAQLNPFKIELTTDEDYLNEGIFNINAGNLDRSLELFQYLKNKNYSDPYVSYLIALAYAKKDNFEQAMENLKKCIKKDECYKVIAFNEADFSTMFEDETFAADIR